MDGEARRRLPGLADCGRPAPDGVGTGCRRRRYFLTPGRCRLGTASLTASMEVRLRLLLNSSLMHRPGGGWSGKSAASLVVARRVQYPAGALHRSRPPTPPPLAAATESRFVSMAVPLHCISRQDAGRAVAVVSGLEQRVYAKLHLDQRLGGMPLRGIPPYESWRGTTSLKAGVRTRNFPHASPSNNKMTCITAEEPDDLSDTEPARL
jgi:hypothetical protein